MLTSNLASQHDQFFAVGVFFDGCLSFAPSCFGISKMKFKLNGLGMCTVIL
jgi:hypothetical protein